MMRKIVLTMLLSAGLISFSCAQDKMTPEFLWKLGRVSDPQLSKDGKECLYNIRNFSLQLNKGNSDIWKVNVASGAAVKLAGDSANEMLARWSSDGKKIF